LKNYLFKRWKKLGWFQRGLFVSEGAEKKIECARQFKNKNEKKKQMCAWSAKVIT
jgi:hypothetical protein